MKTYLGIDVGSISTKFVLINEENQILFASYFRTGGNPIEAIKKGLRELKNQISKPNPDIEIAGVGTTGSARYLAGVITGADLIKNEITAHAKGVCHFVPDARTIIEIGGQDSKIIILENGVVVDFAMNLICLKGNTKITTNPGYTLIPIKEIKIGQKVLTHQGRFKPVEKVFERKYQGEMIKIEISNLKKLDVTPNHPILGLKREDIKCYQSYSRNNITICKPSEERSCKKYCLKYKNFSWEPKFIPAEELREGDFIATPLPLKTQGKSSVSKEILKGFFRGEGEIRKRDKNAPGSDKKGNRYVASTVSENLAHQLYWLLLRNKIKSTLSKRSDKTKGGQYVYLLSVYGKELNKLEDKILVNPKKQSYKSFIYSKWIFEPIKKIKKYKFKGMVYNLNIKGDHSYVANLIGVKNCAAGTGSFLDAQAFRMGVPVEKFGEIALKSKNPTVVGSRCTVFAESDMIHKQQIGHSREDIIAGLCQGLARNFLNNVAKGKNIKPPIVFLGGVSENIGMRKAFEQALGQEIIVPRYNTVMGALGTALLVKELAPQKTKFRSFEISDKSIKCTSFQCQGCPNRCEVIEARIDGKIVARWGDRCGKWSALSLQI